MARYLGPNQIGVCARCDFKTLAKNLRSDGRLTNLLVCQVCWDPEHPLDYPPPPRSESLPRHIPAPENIWLPMTLDVGLFVSDTFQLVWTARERAARISYYTLYTRVSSDDEWAAYATYTPTYNSFSGVIDPATSAYLPIDLFSRYFRIVVTDEDGYGGEAELYKGDQLGYTIEYHLLNGMATSLTHVSGLDASSLRELSPGDASQSNWTNPDTGYYYGTTGTNILVYGLINADSSGTIPPGASAYANMVFTPAQSGSTQLQVGFNPVKRFFWSIQHNFDGSTPRPDFYYASAPGQFIPLAPNTTRYGRGFRTITWTDELGNMYVLEQADAGGAGTTTNVLKKFTDIGVAAQIGAPYVNPPFTSGPGQDATARGYGYATVFVPELSYIFVPRLVNQTSDTTNVPWRVPFTSSYDINVPLVGTVMSTCNGASGFCYSPELGILVAGISVSWATTASNPKWSTDAGATWTAGTNLSGTGLLSRATFITWHPEISAFIASTDGGANSGQSAFISHDGKNWILLGRFYGTQTGGSYNHRLIRQYRLKPIPPEYPTLDPRIGTTSANAATLSNGNMTVTTANGSGGYRPTQLSKYRGKWYWEVTATAGSTFTAMRSGVVRRGVGADDRADYGGGGGAGAGFILVAPGAGWNVYNESATPTALGSGTTLVVGGRICFAMDLDANKIWFGQNGVWRNGDPATGTGGLTLAAGNFAPLVGHSNPTGIFSSTLVVDPALFANPVPAGFSPLTRTTY